VWLKAGSGKVVLPRPAHQRVTQAVGLIIYKEVTMPKHRKSLCYFCGKPSTSTEHAPPEMFFRDFSCDSITAPSCDDHNSRKSGDDQSIVSAMIQSLYNMHAKNGSIPTLSPEVQKAIETAKSSFRYTKKRVKNVDLFEGSSLKDEFPKVAHLQGRIDGWIKQLTAVLVWDATKSFDKSIDWDKAIVQSPHSLPFDFPKPPNPEEVMKYADASQEVDEMESKIDWIGGWSAYPRSYPLGIYQFYFTDARENDLIFKHRFYETYNIFVLFSANEKIIKAVYERAISFRIKS